MVKQFSREYKEYLQSKQWREIRWRKLKQERFTCENCHTSFKASNLHVHHLSYEHLGYERDWELEVLCIPCHKVLHENKDFANQNKGDYLAFVKQQNGDEDSEFMNTLYSLHKLLGIRK